jgi:ABC-type transport system involved in multi-copper enzyme maturation permease subunit
VSRAEYLLGKFFGNFFVLVCCQFCFALTALLLQGFSREGMIVLPARVLPYLQHFFFFVVVTSLALGAICFTVGTLTRNVKVVYGLGISFYFVYIAWQLTIKGLPVRWRIALDPLLFNVAFESARGRSAEWLNQTAVGYDAYMIANRALMVFVSFLCLFILHRRFSTTERDKRSAGPSQTSILDLAPRAERLSSEPESPVAAQPVQAVETVAVQKVALPHVNLDTRGWRANLRQLSAALAVEFRLLRAERSLVVVAPLVMLLCGLELTMYGVARGISYSAGYAGRTEGTLLCFLFGVAVFYTGETMHRDRELRVEPLLWSAPAPNPVLLFSKLLAALLLSLSLVALVGLTAVGVQAYKGHAPIELQSYLATYAVILIPSVVFLTAASAALNVLLRDKYLTYAVSLALGGALYYLTAQGFRNWLYNPVLYQLWTPADLLNGGSQLTRILAHRVYTLALSAALLALALIFFGREDAKGFKAGRRLTGKGWTILAAVASTLIAVITGLAINAGT